MFYITNIYFNLKIVYMCIFKHNRFPFSALQNVLWQYLFVILVTIHVWTNMLMVWTYSLKPWFSSCLLTMFCKTFILLKYQFHNFYLVNSCIYQFATLSYKPFLILKNQDPWNITSLKWKMFSVVKYRQDFTELMFFKVLKVYILDIVLSKILPIPVSFFLF